VLFAWLVLAELPTPVQLVGGLLIVAGLAAVRADESRGPAPRDGADGAAGAAGAADEMATGSGDRAADPAAARRAESSGAP
jgi:hypothetical protein